MEHRIRPIIMFDSNAIDFMIHPSRAENEEKAGAGSNWDLENAIVASGYGLNIDFYVYEVFMTNGISKEVLERLVDPIEQLFKLQNCQQEPWIRERKRVVDLNSAKQVFEEAGVKDFRGLAKVHIDMLLARWKNGMAVTFKHWESASYVMLLKAVQLGADSAKETVEKMELLWEFELEVLGVSFMREKIFAALYMEGRSQPARDFIFKNIRQSGLRRKLRGSARDLLLPRFAERSLVAHLGQGEFLIPHLLTFDRPLLGLSNPIQLHHLYCRNGDRAWTVVYDFEHLRTELLKAVSAEVLETLLSNPGRACPEKKGLSGMEWDSLVENLESQVSRLLRVAV
ncbi:hypothetical protein [Mesoterricola sediminis]|nr:hypothetical protein [Mesoterricola sediminis]